ncbi:hypothetical protein GQ44DRAFT_776748 [Phaeosphaeriaceae sp. PMI808]|nr:hypothetical protein GQ44DRAFT_776748 [Phaeosphaeriaceae sp. PMI808]
MSAQRRNQFFDLDNDGGDVDEDVDEDVSEGESSVHTSSDEEPTTEDRAFIVPDTYESSGEDVDSDDEIDEEDAHVGYIESDGTFVPLAGYEDLMLKPSLKLRILRKHTVEQPARCLRLRCSGQDSVRSLSMTPVKEAACSESLLLDMMCPSQRK